MIEITNKTSGASFVYTEDNKKVSGSYVVNENKEFATLNGSLYINDAYKGNAYIEDGEVKYTFQNVSASEIPALISAMDACKAEIEAQL